MKNIYVGNLSFGATEDTVRALFAPHGTVGRVNICTDRDSGQPRGFGFVDGRALNINEARPKTERAGAGGGGFRRKRW